MNQETLVDLRKPPLHGYLPTLDGWRAIAILLVLLTHDRVHRLGPLSTAWLHTGAGLGGVELFFAISGLLICSRLLAEQHRTGTLHLRTFYLKRCFRIWPAAWFYLLILALLMRAGVLQPAQSGIVYSLLTIRNYLPLQLQPQDWYTLHFWSLSVEEHFYLFLPAFLLLVRRHRLRVAILLSLVLLLSVWQRFAGVHPALTFGWWPAFHTDIAVRGILIAAAAAVLVERQAARAWCERWLNPYLVLLAAAVLSIVCYDHTTYVTSDAMLLIYTPLVLSTLARPHSLPGRLLEWSPLRFIGRMSYSLYLWQMLLLPFNMPLANPHAHWLLALTNSVWRYPTVFAIASASYFGLEKPLIRVGHRITHTRLQRREP
ncbi:acyltransferase family protein [Granulicella paludicola]|uniref:acyltransferase family protein n=1 Tax=Granulicella paludicola TaxID=474951 RepID=UPI0021E08BA4|nr:acyltransferase [Granulicella paludicola]